MLHRFLESPFDHCSDHCGWIAAVIAALSYGTFGVPIKQTVSVDVNPFVLQTYKTATMFVMSWWMVWMGEAVRFTPWGLLSGLLWVLGGTGGIFGIRNAGMAVAVGTWSSCMVIINFLVGILIFREPVASIPSTFAAFVLLGLGLIGMSVFSAPPQSSPPNPANSPDTHNPLMETELMETEQDTSTEHDIVQVPADRSLTTDNQVTARATPIRSRSSEHLETTTAADYDPLRDPAAAPYEMEGIWRRDSKKDHVVLFNNHSFGLTKRQLGILGAVVNGVLTGCSLVPIHYAKKQGFGGAAYMLSFASGALLSNLTIWLCWFGVRLFLSRSDTSNFNIGQAYQSMPPFYLRQLWAPGFSAGVLLAVAMFGSIMSVTYLGQGVGNSVIQSKILISGLWGIFWYREIAGGLTIAKWFASAALAVSGILWLSYERIHAKGGAELHL